ncbi:MAG: hypothetical protein R6V54_04430 [Desulfobacteraceae bacterium]
MGAPGCGKKGPPLVPVKEMPHAPTDLFATSDGEIVTLKWSMEPEEPRDDTRVEIFRAKRNLSGDGCNGCPLEFEKRATTAPGSLVYSDVVEKGFAWYYRVRAVAGKDLASAYSKTVQIRVEQK